MRESPRLVISNTTPLIALTLIGRLDLLRQLYGTVTIPTAVRDELRAARSGAVAVDLESLPWIRIIAASDSRVQLIVGLDRGEAEVVALAEELSADLVLIDERLGRRYAQRLGIPLSGTLGVLLKAKTQGYVPALAPLIEALRQSGIHLSQALVEEALRLADEY